MRARGLGALIPIGLLLLFAMTRPTPAPHHRSQSARKPTVAVSRPAAVSIVAIRGQPLAEHEEPLPEGARVRFGSTRFRHPVELSGFNATIAGRFLVTLDDKEVTLTDVETGKRVLSKHFDLGEWHQVKVVASTNGKRLLVCTMFPERTLVGELFQVDPEPKRPLIPIGTVHVPPRAGMRFIQEIQFSSDTSELLLLGNNLVARYDAADGRLRGSVPTEKQAIRVSADGRRFLTSSEPHIGLRLGGRGFGPGPPQYRFRLPEPTADKPESKPPRHGMQEEEPGYGLSSVILTVCDTRSGRVLASIAVPYESRDVEPQFELSPDGRYLSHAFRDCVCVWEVGKQQEVIRFGPLESTDPGKPLPISGTHFTDDGCHIVVWNSNPKGRRFDLTTGTQVGGESSAPRSFRFFGSEFRADLIGEHGTVGRKSSKEPLPPGYAGTVVDYSSVGLIAIGDAAGRLDVWSTDGRLVKSLLGGGKGIAAVAFSPDGKQLAACEKGRVLRVWRVETWRERDRVNVPADTEQLVPHQLTFTPDGAQLLVSHGEIMALWDLQTREWLWDRPGELEWSRRYSPTFTSDGGRIASLGYEPWIDAGTGEPSTEGFRATKVGQRFHEARSDGQERALSQDARAVGFARSRGTMDVWNIASDQLVRNFPESKLIHSRRGLLRFSPDGRRLVTCDDKGHAHVWEIATGQLAFTLDYPGGDIANVFFTRDGRSLITSNHREVIVWDLSAEPGAAKTAWADLAREAPAAEQARRALLANPAITVDLFEKQLRPAKPVTGVEVNKVIQQLDAKNYRERERAAADLIAIGRRALPFVREAKLTSEEGVARLATLVRDLSAGMTPNELRYVRSIELLGQIDTPAARELVKILSTGDPADVLTEEAKKQVELMTPRPAIPATKRPVRKVRSLTTPDAVRTSAPAMTK
jgi:WD40 repeat protein